MDGVSAIRERILEEAAQEAHAIVRDAEEKAEAVTNEKKAQAQAVRERLMEEHQSHALDVQSRKVSVARLDMRKDELAVKQEMIDMAFENCLSAIRCMTAGEYSDFMENLLISAVITGEEEVVFAGSDVSRLDRHLLGRVNTRLTEMGKKGLLKASDFQGDFSGGFILRSGGMELNYTLESILRVIRDEIEPMVAEMLFA